MENSETKNMLRETLLKEGKKKLKKLLNSEGISGQDAERVIKRVISLLEQGQDNRLRSFLIRDLDLDEDKAERLVGEITDEYLKWDPIFSL